MKTGMKNIVEQFLDEIDVAYTRRFADTLYSGHPHKNNMYGLKMMLDVYGIRSIGVRIEDKDLSALSFPCILHTGDDFVIVSECTESHVRYRHKGIEKTASHDGLRRIWTGNALVVDGESDAREPDYRRHRREEMTEAAKRFSLPIFLIAAVIAGIAGNLSETEPYAMACTALNAAGLAACMLLMQKQIFGSSRYGDKVCSLLSHSGCNSVLDGDASKFMGMTWSEIGLGYFAADILVCSIMPGAVGIVAVINWIAMLYGIWSIHYQWRIARSWCTLCVTVQAIVWLTGAIYAIHSRSIPFRSGIADTVLVCVLFGACIAVTHMYAMTYSAEEERLRILQRYRSLKADGKIAKALIMSGEYHETTPGDSTIIFGPRDAGIRITILSNPHCNPCARMHRKVESLLALNSRNICVQYIFSSFSRDLDDSSRYLISCCLKNDEDEALRLLDKWYAGDKSKYSEIISRRQSDIHTEEVEKEMERHREWRNRVRFSSTPTVLVNGHILPEEYDLMDLAMIADI